MGLINRINRWWRPPEVPLEIDPESGLDQEIREVAWDEFDKTHTGTIQQRSGVIPEHSPQASVLATQEIRTVRIPDSPKSV